MTRRAARVACALLAFGPACGRIAPLEPVGLDADDAGDALTDELPAAAGGRDGGDAAVEPAVTDCAAVPMPRDCGVRALALGEPVAVTGAGELPVAPTGPSPCRSPERVMDMLPLGGQLIAAIETVYWGGLRGCPWVVDLVHQLARVEDGCGGVDLLTPEPAMPHARFQDAPIRFGVLDDVLFSTLAWSSTAGIDVRTLPTVLEHGRQRALTAGGGKLYWLEETVVPCEPDCGWIRHRFLVSLSDADGDPEVLLQARRHDSEPPDGDASWRRLRADDLAADEQGVYWVADDTVFALEQSGLRQLADAPNPWYSIYSAIPPRITIQLHDRYVFVGARLDGKVTVERVSRADGSRMTFLDPYAPFLVEGDRLYFLRRELEGCSGVLRAPVEGGPPEWLVALDGANREPFTHPPELLAAHEGFLYWAADERLYRAAL